MAFGRGSQRARVRSFLRISRGPRPGRATSPILSFPRTACAQTLWVVEHRFRPFSLEHVLALGSIVVLTMACAAAVRLAPRSGAWLRTGVAVLLPLALFSLLGLDANVGVSWRSYAPLQLCDLAVAIAVFALLTGDALAFELTYTFSVAGTLPALLTPDVAEGFPHWRFVLYMAQHGGLVVASGTLLAAGLRPRRGTPLRALFWLNAVALAVGLVDALTGANFMYLREKPGAATPLDAFGPWPFYLVTCELLALLVFVVACAPFSVFRSNRVSD